MNLIFFVLFIILVEFTKNQTIQPSLQSYGCSEQMISFNGVCYKEINGCLNYKSPNECLKCSDDYLLMNSLCEVDTQKIVNLMVKTSFNYSQSKAKGSSKQTVKLSSSDKDKLNKIVGIISKKFGQINSTLDKISIKDILKTPFQTYFYFTWMNSLGKTFIFQYSINLTNSISQILSQQYDPNLQNITFSRINSRLTQKYADKLVESTLTRIVSVSKNLYKLHYFSDFGSHYIVFVQKMPYIQIKPLQTVSWQSDDAQIIDFVYSQIPNLVKQASYIFTKRPNNSTNQWQIKFISESKVVVVQPSYQTRRILFYYREQNKSVQTNSKLVGGYQVFKDNEDEIIRKVLNHLFSQFKFLKKSQITKIQYQIVAGTNFLVHLKDSSNKDEYMCKMFYSLSGQVNILEIYMNNVLIHTQPLAPVQVNPSYNYKTDPIFDIVNNYLKDVQNITLPEDILYVNQDKRTNQFQSFYEYEIVYQQNSYIATHYYLQGPRIGTIELVDFIENGDNNLQGQSLSQQAGEKIKTFLQSYRKYLHPLVFEYFKETKPNQYLCKIITEYGSYFYKIIEKDSNQFEIYYFELIDSNQNCMTHSKDQIKKFQLSQRSFLTTLKLNYNISQDSQLKSFSEGIFFNQRKYRLLYVNSVNSKKEEIFLTQKENNLSVQSVRDQNNGFYLITDMDLYKKAVQKAISTFTNTLKGGKPIFAIMNSQKIKIYIAKSQSKQIVYQIELQLNLQKGLLKSFLQQSISKDCKSFDQNGNCAECTQNSTALLSNCYEKIKSCRTQIGKSCLMCENQYTLKDNQCVNQCNLLM